VTKVAAILYECPDDSAPLERLGPKEIVWRCKECNRCYTVDDQPKKTKGRKKK